MTAATMELARQNIERNAQTGYTPPVLESAAEQAAEPLVVVTASERARMQAEALAATPELIKASIKEADRVCRRAKPACIGAVLKLHDTVDMVQVDFSESKGPKVRASSSSSWCCCTPCCPSISFN